MYRSPWVIALCMGSAALLTGCPKEASPTPTDGGADAPVASAAAASPGSAVTAAPGSATAAAEDSRAAQATLDTAGVLCVARALQQGGIDVADAVASRLREPETRELAATMRIGHRRGLERVTALAIQLGGVAPKESDLSQAVVKETAEVIAKLEGADDSSVDREYLAAQVAMHGRALQLLDEVLVPATSDQRVLEGLALLRSQVTRRVEAVEEVGN